MLSDNEPLLSGDGLRAARFGRDVFQRSPVRSVHADCAANLRTRYRSKEPPTRCYHRLFPQRFALEEDIYAFDEAMGLARYRPPQRAADDWPAFVAMLSALREKTAKWPSDFERVRLWYEPHMERIHEDGTTRRADLLQLEQIASGYPSRERFLTELTLDPPDAS